MANTEGSQIFLDALKDDVLAVILAQLGGLGFVKLQQVGLALEHFRGDILDVFTLVEIFRLGHILSAQLLGAVEDGTAENEHLASGIVNVIFRLDVVSGFFQNTGQGIAKGCTTSVADMKRTGRVGGDILHLNAGAVTHGGITVGFSGLFDDTHSLVPEGLTEGKVEETGSGDIDFFDVCIPFKGCGNIFGNGTRGFFRLLGKHHGHVDGHVAELFIFGRLDHSLFRPFPALVGQNRFQCVFKMYFRSHALVSPYSKLVLRALARLPRQSKQ